MNDMPFVMPPTDFSNVPELTGILPYPGVVLEPQTVENELARLRELFPFVPLIPFPNSVASVVCVNAGQPYELNIPNAATFGFFSAQGIYYVCAQGNAQIPQAGADQGASQSIYRPDRQLFFIGNKSSFSVVSPTAGQIVQFAAIII